MKYSVGVVFPPLALSFLLTMIMKRNYHIYTINQYVTYAMKNNKWNYVNMINKECLEFLDKKVFIGSIWMIVTFSCIFYSLFLFDTLGSKVGLNNSYWVLIVMCLLPLVYYGVYKLIHRLHYQKEYNNSNDKDNVNETKDSISEEKTDIEMTSNPINGDQSIVKETKVNSKIFESIHI